MFAPRAIAVEGVGYSPRLLAVRGLWPAIASQNVVASDTLLLSVAESATVGQSGACPLSPRAMAVKGVGYAPFVLAVDGLWPVCPEDVEQVTALDDAILAVLESADAAVAIGATDEALLSSLEAYSIGKTEAPATGGKEPKWIDWEPATWPVPQVIRPKKKKKKKPLLVVFEVSPDGDPVPMVPESDWLRRRREEELLLLHMRLH